MSQVNDLYFVLLQQLKTKTQNIQINSNTIITVLKFSMEIVEASHIKGRKQRDIAIRLIKQIVVDAPITNDNETLLLQMIDSGILGNTIDLVVSATKGDLDINSAAQVAVNCCLALLQSRKKK